MKKIISFIIAVVSYNTMQAQSANPGEALASRIAQKMQDSLALNNQQKDSIYSVNMQLHNRKMFIHQQYAAGDSLVYHLQKIENTRDSLYRPVLSEAQFILYRQKKKNLVNNN